MNNLTPPLAPPADRSAVMTAETKLKYDHHILVVDDEEYMTRALQRLFRRDGFTVHTALSGETALELLKSLDKPISLIISDQRMPMMSGAEFLEKAREISPDTIRFLLTGYSDMEAIVAAINRGGIHRYMKKPWDDGELRFLARQFLHQLELVMENRRLQELTSQQNEELEALNHHLEAKVEERTEQVRGKNAELQKLNLRLKDSFLEALRLLSGYVETQSPRLGRYMRNVARFVRDVAGDLGLEGSELDDIEIAGLYHDIGFVGLPERIWTMDENDAAGDGLKAIRQHPLVAAMALESVDKLQGAAAIIRHHHERVDGSGYPDGLKGDAISIGSRVLGAVADYCWILETWPRNVEKLVRRARRYLGPELAELADVKPDRLLHEVAGQMLLQNVHKYYDVKVVARLIHRADTVLEESTGESGAGHAVIDMEELEAGMILTEDLRMSDGRLLLVKDTQLTAATVGSIRNLGRNQLIKAYVRT